MLLNGVFLPLYVFLEGVFESGAFFVFLYITMQRTFLQRVFRVVARRVFTGLFRVLLYLFFTWQVAKKYNLYTKVTGGQRIDMFGAEKHQVCAASEENDRRPAVQRPLPARNPFLWSTYCCTHSHHLCIHTDIRAYMNTFIFRPDFEVLHCTP